MQRLRLKADGRIVEIRDGREFPLVPVTPVDRDASASEVRQLRLRNRLTQEQTSGATQILGVAQRISDVSRQVSTAAQEQAQGSKEILKAVTSMNSMTQQVADATVEQKKGGDMVVKAMETIANVARVTRPGKYLKTHYNEGSKAIYQGVSQILNGTPAKNVLPSIESKLKRLLR